MNTFINAVGSNMPEEIINNIRNRLFEIKTKHGMIPYSLVKNFLLNNTKIYDIYANEPKDSNKLFLYNIEHAVLASIISKRPKGDKEEKIYINNEPYHDPHILFPTLRAINSLRSNYMFGDLEENGFKMEKIIDNITIETIKNKGYKEEDKLHIEKIPIPTDFNIDDSIIINDECKIKQTNKTSRQEYYNCKLGECIFEPKNLTSGTIARIVFYYFLMYAYDPTKRPHTNTEPWLVYDMNTITGGRNICYGLKDDEWEKFFYDNFYYYYYSAKKYPITDLETERNKEIISLTGVPNIFVGYYDDKGNYVKSSFDFIDELMGFVPPSELNKVLNCKLKGITTDKTYGSTIDITTIKYLIKDAEIDEVKCNNDDFYNIISNQVETLKLIKVYKTNIKYKNTFENIYNLLKKIEELFKDFTENDFNKFANLVIKKLNEINLKMDILTDLVTKKLKSISEQKILVSELKTIYLDANNKLEEFHEFIRKKIDENTGNTEYLEKFNKILKNCETIQINETEKKKLNNILDKVINDKTETQIKTKIEHKCKNNKYYEKYLKYKNKYLALKKTKSYFNNQK